jgi:hypothetical protein
VNLHYLYIETIFLSYNVLNSYERE